MDSTTLDPVEYMQSKDRELAYLEWLKLPMTQHMIRMMEYQANRCFMLSPPKLDESDGARYCVHFGRMTLIDFMRRMDQFTRVTKEKRKEEALGEADYGASMMDESFVVAPLKGEKVTNKKEAVAEA